MTDDDMKVWVNGIFYKTYRKPINKKSDADTLVK